MCMQIDPYLNVDAGTMSPFEHGEVFVLDDGGETDLVCTLLHYSGNTYRTSTTTSTSSTVE